MIRSTDFLKIGGSKGGRIGEESKGGGIGEGEKYGIVFSGIVMGPVSAVVSTMGLGFVEVCLYVVMSSSTIGLEWKEGDDKEGTNDES